jgi:hypothetical protein
MMSLLRRACSLSHKQPCSDTPFVVGREMFFACGESCDLDKANLRANGDFFSNMSRLKLKCFPPAFGSLLDRNRAL